ncbi:MAG: DUF2911 domain-containing protein [Bacteroidota bacterium]
MKNLFAILSIACLMSGAFSANAQNFPKADASIMDMAYFPERSAFFYFAKNDEEKKARTKKMRVVYSRPAMKGRTIFGDLIPYNQMWRVGANESTELLLFADAKVGGKKLKAGERYTVHVMPKENEWTIYFSTELDGWGSYSFQNAPEKTTVAQVTVPVEKTSTTLELLGIYFEATDKGANMVIGWENTMVKVPFELN